ncbi:amidase family protein [Paenibacillus sp. FSL H7-0918]|uniref:amidase family protein n=1 Tax=Paenibacillus sp. FSL H7-0918 TaxID=2921442 RepID=UPI0030F5C74F
MVLDNRYGAFIDPELTVESLGSGILDGLTFAVKDVFAVAGHSSSAGNPDWLHSHHPSTEHAVAVHRLLLSGATLRGAAHTDELMYSLGGENHHFGTPINPRAVGRIPGGSSSGSAVAVASGSVDFALGTDTGGSIRVPSSYCGVYGFRPTHGAVDFQGVIPLSPAFDTIGWMSDRLDVLQKVGEVLLVAGSTSVKTAKKIESSIEETVGKSMENTDENNLEMSRKESLETILEKRIEKSTEEILEIGPENKVKKKIEDKIKMGTLFVATDCWALVNLENAAILSEGLRCLRSGADHLMEIEIALEGLKVWMDVFRELQGNEIWETHGVWIENKKPVFGPDIAARFSWAASLAEEDHSVAKCKQKEISNQMRLLLGEDNCLVIPTVPGPAPLRGGDLRQLEENRSGAMMLSCIAGLAGLPQVTIPMLSTSGLPLGLSVIAGHGQDLRLLSWANEVWQQS